MPPAPRDAVAETDSAAGDGNTDESDRRRRPRKGHGRNGADAYRGAARIERPRTRRSQRATRVRRAVRAPSTRRPRACWCGSPGSRRWRRRIYELQKLRCHLCGQVFTAPAPQRRATRKYDATAGSMIGLLKYGSGLPFNRLDGLQGNLGDSAAGLDAVGHRAGGGGEPRSGV